MVSPKSLVSIVESTLVSPTPPTPLQKAELLHALKDARPLLHPFLSYPGPKSSDRSQLLSKQIRLPDIAPGALDDNDIHIALKLSDVLNLNEIECVRLLVSTHQQWDIYGRDPVDIFHLAAGVWYTERRALITTLYMILRAVVLDQELEEGLVVELQTYLEDLLKSGLRQRLNTLIKELARIESASSSASNLEALVIDSRGALVDRRDVIQKERLSIGHCLVLSVLVVQTNATDVKNMLFTLKECAAELSVDGGATKLQIVFSIFFGLLISFISDALSTVSDGSSVLWQDASFRREFRELIMGSATDPNAERFLDAVKLVWSVYLMLTIEGASGSDTSSVSTSHESSTISSCIEHVCSRNIFSFVLDKILRTSAFQNDDEDIVYMYTAYLHKLISCFLSQSIVREKVKEMKESAMSSPGLYMEGGATDVVFDNGVNEQNSNWNKIRPFISLLELVSEIYKREPELLSGNEAVWTFVNFAGEDHANVHTLVAFLTMLSSLASSEEGASRVHNLMQKKAFRSVSWHTLFESLSMYEQKFKMSLQNSPLLPEFPEGDAKAIVAYLRVLQKVMVNGNPVERTKWFPDTELFFKLLGYENVPPSVKGALRNTITIFMEVSLMPKDTVWRYLEQYDLPVVLSSPVIANQSQQLPMQVYDMKYELNEVEAREERYPSTISFINLLNMLIRKETDKSDQGIRFLGVFRFVYDHVFGPFTRRGYADVVEKWQLVIACLQHFQILLTMYNVKTMSSNLGHPIRNSVSARITVQKDDQIPVVELFKDFMSGRVAFQNIMGILLPGVNGLINDRSNQIHGPLVEKAVLLSFEILLHVFEADQQLAACWGPQYQPLDVIISQECNQIIALLEYVRYEYLPKIQHCSIKVLNVLSSRMVELVPLLLDTGAANQLIEDYASCLEVRAEDKRLTENDTDDAGVLILKLLIDNMRRRSPNITHLLLKFDVESPVERSILLPKYHYSCLKVILDMLEGFTSPDINWSLYEFSFQLIYELCSDSYTATPFIGLLASRNYQFFLKHLDSLVLFPLPKRHSNQALRVSSLHQRAWLLKIFAVELHVADMGSSVHQELCTHLLSSLFEQETGDVQSAIPLMINDTPTNTEYPITAGINKCKALRMLNILQFKPPDTSMSSLQALEPLKWNEMVGDILHNPATVDSGGIYFFSDRGDRLIDITAFSEKLCQVCNLSTNHNNSVSTGDVAQAKDYIQKLLRWSWTYNRNLEEQSAQLHLMLSWSQVVEISISQRLSLLTNRTQIVFELLSATLNATTSPDCSLRMAVILTQVALACMARLRDERFLAIGDSTSDNITCLDVVTISQLSSGACQYILQMLIVSIVRRESSEGLRRRQYALLISYIQHCQSLLDPNIPESLLRFLVQENQDGDEDILKKLEEEHRELSSTNFIVLKKEAHALLDVLMKDAIHGNEVGRAISLYALDAIVSIDQEQFFLTQLQSRGFLKQCLSDISNPSFLGGCPPSPEYFQRLCTLEAELALLLRVSCNYAKCGTQHLYSIGALEHLSSCKALDRQMQGGIRYEDSLAETYTSRQTDKKISIVAPALRLVLCLTSLVDASNFLEVKNKVVRDIVQFIKENQRLFDQVLMEDLATVDDSSLELIDILAAIISKVWPYDELDEFGFVQALFSMMKTIFSQDVGFFHNSFTSRSLETPKSSGLVYSRLCYNLISYLHYLIRNKGLKLQVSQDDDSISFDGGRVQPSLSSIVNLICSITSAILGASDEKALLISKIQGINDLSRYEVDEIIHMCTRKDYETSSDDIRKRRHIAMVEMCRIVGNRDQLITLFLLIMELALDILFDHLRSREYDPANRNMRALFVKLLPSLERLYMLNEEKIGHNLKFFSRLVSSVKEYIIRQTDS